MVSGNTHLINMSQLLQIWQSQSQLQKCLLQIPTPHYTSMIVHLEEETVSKGENKDSDQRWYCKYVLTIKPPGPPPPMEGLPILTILCPTIGPLVH